MEYGVPLDAWACVVVDCPDEVCGVPAGESGALLDDDAGCVATVTVGPGNRRF